jgi:hypothetical protein
MSSKEIRSSFMRPSLASNRTSYAAGLASKAPNPAATLKLLEKKKEFDAVSALEKATALFLDRIEGLGEDCDIMADAAQGKSLTLRPDHYLIVLHHLVHGQVLEQWPKMFEILNLFRELKCPSSTGYFLTPIPSRCPRAKRGKRIQR